MFVSEFKQLAAEYYSPSRCFHHYLSMAFGNARDYLRHDLVWMKNYLYVLRPLLACRWIEDGLGPVPMLFDHLVVSVVEDADVRAAIGNLVARERAGDELDRAPKVEVLNRFIAEELGRLEKIQLGEVHLPALPPFMDTIKNEHPDEFIDAINL
jgi:predicted nucleotidyltransferase